MTDGQLPFETPSAPDDSMEVLPAGRYTVMVESFQMKTTKARDGSYAEITFVVTDARNAGRKLWGRYTTANPNQQAVSIGKRQLGELSYACGNTQPLTNLNQILGKSCQIEVVIREDPQYGKQNDIKRAYPLDGAQNRAPQSQSLPQGQTGAQSGSAPWDQI